MSDALDAYKQQKAFLAHDPVKARIEHYKQQPLAYEVPEHILTFTERRKLVLQTPYFRIPPWAGMPPTHGAHLEVVKDGITAARWPLYKAPYVLIGKNAQVCDYVMEHPSTSGVHCAVVYHAEKATFFVIDLSSNGTAINGQRLVKGQPAALHYDSVVTVALSTRQLVMRKTMTQTQMKKASGEGKNGDLTVADPFPPLEKKATETCASPSAAVTAVDAATAAAAPAPAALTGAAAAYAETAMKDREAAHPHLNPNPLGATSDSASAPAPSPAPPAIVPRRHFRHLLIKHVDCADPVSKAPRNKGEPITRSPADAVELAGSLRQVLMAASTTATSCDEAMFIEYCQQYSECKTSKKGGDLGMIEKGDMDANFDGPAFRLGPGAVSPPVTTDLGVHLIYRCAE